MEKYFGTGAAAVGADKAIINLFNTPASPTARARIFSLVIGCEAAPADAATDWKIQRTSAVGTETSGFTPVNLDAAGPASTYDFGVGFSGGEPTKTASAFLFQASVNQRATLQWFAREGMEPILPATQNAGACVKSDSSTVTSTHEVSLWFFE